MKNEEVQELIKSIVKDTVSEEIAPLKEQATNWSEMLNKGNVRGVEIPEKDRGMAAARSVRALAAAKGDPDKAARFAEKAWNDTLGKAVQDSFTKVASAGEFTSGGFMIPEDMMSDIIELLRPQNVVRAAGASVLGMPRGTMTLPRTTNGPTASYVGENQNIGITEPAGGDLVMSAKKLAAIVPISNDLLNYSVGDQADRWVRDELVRSLAQTEDETFLRGSGTAHSPKGLRYWAANTISQSGTAATDMENDLANLIQLLEGNNVRMSRPAYFMNPRTKNYLMHQRDTGGNLVFEELRSANPTIYGLPVFVSNNIPKNLGSGSDETEVYLVEMTDVIIGEAGGLEITADSTAAYVDGGTTISTFQQDSSAIRALLRHDLAVRHDASVAVLDSVTWGT